MSDLQQLSLRLDDDRAEEVLLGLLSAYESMAAAAPLVYGEDVASTLWQLGNLHADARRFGEAERMYLRALDKHAEFCLLYTSISARRSFRERPLPTP